MKASNHNYELLSQIGEGDVERTPRCSPLSCFANTLCFPWYGAKSCLCVEPNEEIVLLDFGKYNGTIKTPGCHFIGAIGREMWRVSTKVKSIMLPETKTIDRNGNPLIINGILAYRIKNSKRATLDVEYADAFLRTQGLAALKQIVSRYPYEGDHGSGPCLKTAADIIANEMVSILQERLNIAGIQLLTFTFNEISYAPEIAREMLKRQQANALLQARKVIVAGAVDIAQLAVKQMQLEGMVMDDKDKSRLASNLLTVICSDAQKASVHV